MALPKAVIDWFIAKFGGSKKHYSKKKYDPRWKDVHGWVVSARNAVMFLKLVKPYLIVKREQADICIMFQGTVMPAKTYRAGGLSKEVLVKREEYYQTARTLNKRGA